MGLDDLQSCVDVGASVGMSVRWPAQVKQHQFAAGGRHLQELGQGGNGLVLGLRAIRLRKARCGSKRIPLQDRKTGYKMEEDFKVKA